MLKNTNTENKNKNVAVGLSGGVDSSVAAYLLKEQGYNVTGVYMQCWDSKADGCTSDEDRASAVAVASTLGIKFVSLDFIKDYKDKVISYFYNEYKNGRTPNPDIMCNKEIKFGLFLDWAKENGFEYIATGHYARIKSVVESDKTHFKLLKGVDVSKDQSYFLFRLTQKQLASTLFPIGDLKKSEVRGIAKSAKLPTYSRPDSQGICFIGEVNIKDFLAKQIKPQEGKVLFVNGDEIGTHEGVWYFTIGQRHGFKVDKYFGLPLYVVGKNVEKNELIVGYINDVLKKNAFVSDLHWLDSTMDKDFMAEVRVRHLGTLYKCSANFLNPNCLEISMTNPIFGIAPGQSAVFYDKDEVLGGGVIQQ